MTKDVKVPESAQPKVATAPKKRKIASLDKRKARAGWIFVLPFVLGFVCVYLPIVFDSLILSFGKMEILGQNLGYDIDFVGLENFQYALFEDAGFVQILGTGLKELLLDVPAIIIFSLFMAVLLNQKMVGRAAFRAIFFIPVILSTGIMESVASQGSGLSSYMESSSGIDDGSGTSAATEIVSAIDIERLFANMKLGEGLVKYVVSTVNRIYDVVNRSGVQMLIFLAGLQSISPAIYEACRIDGATAWETFWKITFPMISPMILVNGIYTIIDSFTTDSNSVMSYIKTVQAEHEEAATAMSWMYFLIVMLILAIVGGIFSAYVFYQRRDN